MIGRFVICDRCKRVLRPASPDELEAKELCTNCEIVIIDGEATLQKEEQG